MSFDTDTYFFNLNLTEYRTFNASRKSNKLLRLTYTNQIAFGSLIYVPANSTYD